MKVVKKVFRFIVHNLYHKNFWLGIENLEGHKIEKRGKND